MSFGPAVGLGGMSFQSYLDNIELKTGKTPREFIALAEAKGFTDPGVKATPILQWLSDDFGLGRGHGMALVHVFRNGPQIGDKHVNSGGTHSDPSTPPRARRGRRAPVNQLRGYGRTDAKLGRRPRSPGLRSARPISARHRPSPSAARRTTLTGADPSQSRVDPDVVEPKARSWLTVASVAFEAMFKKLAAKMGAGAATVDAVLSIPHRASRGRTSPASSTSKAATSSRRSTGSRSRWRPWSRSRPATASSTRRSVRHAARRRAADGPAHDAHAVPVLAPGAVRDAADPHRRPPAARRANGRADRARDRALGRQG